MVFTLVQATQPQKQITSTAKTDTNSNRSSPIDKKDQNPNENSEKRAEQVKGIAEGVTLAGYSSNYVYAVMYGTTFRTCNRATSPHIIIVTYCVHTQHRTLCSTVILGCTSTIAAHV